jgi:hypothetical protein
VIPRRYLDVSLSFISNLHKELSLSVDHVLQDALVDSALGDEDDKEVDASYGCTYMAPRLSELDTKRYSLPSAIN